MSVLWIVWYYNSLKLKWNKTKRRQDNFKEWRHNKIRVAVYSRMNIKRLNNNRQRNNKELTVFQFHFGAMQKIQAVYNSAHQHNYSLLHLPQSRDAGPKVLYSNVARAGARVARVGFSHFWQEKIHQTAANARVMDNTIERIQGLSSHYFFCSQRIKIKNCNAVSVNKLRIILTNWYIH